MKSKTCKNCGSWKQDHSNEYAWEDQLPPPHGACCDDHFIYTGNGGVTPEDGLGYWDCESYAAGFYTGAEFGCIHWKKGD
jgi:hypothetical protein